MSTDDQIVEALADGLKDITYVCGRVWEAWQYNTMTEDDFSPAWEADDLLNSLAEVIEPIIKRRIAHRIENVVRRMSETMPDALRAAKIEAWNKGYTSGHSNAMRQMSDEPDAPTSVNPYQMEDSDD